jgi:hypothetical protein
MFYCVVKPMLAEKRAEPMVNRVDVAGVELVLAPPDEHDVEWLDFDHCVQRLETACLRLSPEPPLNPRVIGNLA